MVIGPNRTIMTVLPPEIRSRVSFFEILMKDVQKAAIGSELRILYEKFGNYCANLGIVHAFGNITLSNDVCDEEFRKNLLSNIDMAKNVCMSKRDGLSSNPSVLINNTNQQEQTQNISLQLREDLRKTLTGEQYDEIMDLISKKAGKKTIAEKFEEFGIGVVSSVLAGIINNYI